MDVFLFDERLRPIYHLASQLRRTDYSIPFSIVEGPGKNSEKDFAHFLDISLGSGQELEYCILLIKNLNFIGEEQYRSLNEKLNEINVMIINLI